MQTKIAARALSITRCLAVAFFIYPLLAFGSDEGQDSTSKDLKTSDSKLLELSRHPQWRALLHFTEDATKSEIDDPEFFLDPNGKYNPQAELIATLAAFRQQPSNPDESTQCKFIARYRWLTQELPELAAINSNLTCPSYRSWRDGINPFGATLIFPSAYLNNPASAFGHTLLRIDSPGRIEGQALPDYTANYAADTEGDGALLYALRGIFGGYSGYFSVAPYYRKVERYSDIENRDIWEYQLSLSPAEVERIVEHLWELQDVGVSYFYFDENCSYHLLALLDVGRPTLRLRERFDSWVIPVDTVRALQSVPGLIASKNFRPSAATVMLERLRSTPPHLRVLAKDIARGDASIDSLAEFSKEDQAQCLDLAYDASSYSRIRAGEIGTKEKELGYGILRARSQLGIKSNSLEITPPIAPEEGHSTSKVTISTGVRESNPLYQLQLRPAFHDLLDPGHGFSPGAEIRFFELTFEQESSRRFELSKFTPLAIRSITPQNILISPWSWQLELSIDRQYWSDSNRPLIGSLGGGIGRAVEIFDDMTAYLMGGPTLAWGKQLDDGYSAGIGPTVGIMTNPNSDWMGNLSASWNRYGIGDLYSQYQFGGEVRYTLCREQSLRLSVQRRLDYSTIITESLVSIHLTF